MSFLYPRTVAITRPNGQTGPGSQGYFGLDKSKEISIATNLPASIQSSRERTVPLGKTPSDAESKSQWNIYIPLEAVAAGTIKGRDKATDDLGRVFMITASDPTSLGYRLRCELLEA